MSEKYIEIAIHEDHRELQDLLMSALKKEFPDFEVRSCRSVNGKTHWQGGWRDPNVSMVGNIGIGAGGEIVNTMTPFHINPLQAQVEKVVALVLSGAAQE